MNTHDLLTALWTGGQHGLFWTSHNRRSYWLSEPPAEIRDKGVDLYFGVHPTTAIPPTNARGEPRDPRYVRSQNAYIAAINCVYGDYDARDYADKDAAMNHIRTFVPTPSVVIDSGGGYHAYWLLSECLVIVNEDTREYARQLQKRWSTHCGADPKACDLSRVLRVPGTRNHKYTPARPVEIVRVRDVRYSVYDLERRLPPLPRPKRREYTRTETTAADYERAVMTARRMIADAPDGTKHGELLKASKLLGGFVGSGVASRSDAEGVLRGAIEGRAVDSLEGAYKTIEDGLRYGEAAPL